MDHLSLRFPDAGIIALSGPNGAGKSTLVNLATGFMAPDSGVIRVHKNPITRFSPKHFVKAGVARTFQDVRLIRRISVLDNVLLAIPHGRHERLSRVLFRSQLTLQRKELGALARKYLELVGLAKYSDQLAGNLSYGEGKLLAIACCVATGSNILFFDEPIAGIHPKIASRILRIAHRLAADQKLVIVVEHSVLAMMEASRLIVMNKGTVLADGVPEKVLQAPQVVNAYLGYS